MTCFARNILILATLMAAIFSYSPANAEEAEACTGPAFVHSSDYLYKKQAGFYMAAYEQGAIDLSDMAFRLAAYAEKYEGLDDRFAAFLVSRKEGGVDFRQPISYVLALADFLASVDVETHMPAMCDTVEELAKQDQPV